MFGQNSLRMTAIASAFVASQFISLPASAQASNGGSPIEITGEFEVIHIDHDEGRAEHRYYVRDRLSEESFELLFDGRAPRHLRTGQTVTARGRGRGRSIEVTDLSAEGGSPDEAADAMAATMNERNVVVLLVNLADGAASASASEAASHMFNGGNSVGDLYVQSSYGQVTLPADTDGDGQPDVFGPLDTNLSSGSCDYYGWAYAADDAAAAAGVDLSLYRHRMYVLPNVSSCSWSGIANLGCGSYCRAWVKVGWYGPLYAHEFSHNMAMHHASTDPENDGVINSEYGDFSDPVGSSSAGWRGHNAAHKDQMQWFDAVPGSRLTVVSSGTHDIYPLALDPSVAGGPQLLTIDKPDTNEIYYLSYRLPTGIDGSLGSGYTGGVNIHRYRGSGTVQTKFIRTLGDGGLFEDQANGITVTQIGRAPDGSFVTVGVDFGCAVASPWLSLSPSNTGVGPGGSSSHTVSLTNNDANGCPETTFDLIDSYDPGVSGVLSLGQLTLVPGQTGTAELYLTASTADGSYVATVQAVDADGLEPDHAGSVSATATVTVDGTAPWPPTGLTATVSGNGSTVDLAWEIASDDGGSGVAYYRIFRNAGAGYAEIGQSPAPSYGDGSVAYETTYTYMVTAVDLAANESGDSGSATVTTKTKTKTKGKGDGGGSSGSDFCYYHPTHRKCLPPS